MAAEFEEAKKAVYANPTRRKPEDVVRYLDMIRSLSLARPAEVYSLGQDILKNHQKKLHATDKWNIVEDLAIACMQLGKREEAHSLVQSTMKQFPSSLRASRLKGMYHESVGEMEISDATYASCLAKDPQNLMVLHRLVAMKKAKGDISGALEVLHKHLEIHLGDYQAWFEAAKLHIELGSFSQAIFCLEEVMLLQPADVSVHLLLAETLYSSGGATQIRSARRYFSAVLEITNGESMRALYGVCLCTYRLKALGKPCNDNLGAASAEAILERYASDNSKHVEMVKNMLKLQGF